MPVRGRVVYGISVHDPARTNRVNRIARAVARLVNYQPARGSRIINFTRRHEIIYNDVATFYTVVYRST